ncbi:hypothetical protein BJX76DRAFT_315335 [Aspergillus varians]
MSDDEEYFDEFDDENIFWIEEADPTVADDLAAGATYDPNYLDDPSLETAEYFSDWEDISDDYYDEDPTAIRRLRAMGLYPIQEPTDIDSPPTKRRKVVPGKFPTGPGSFQGVTWKHPEDETDVVEIYTPGDGEKVSLLKNWREVFRNAKPAIGRLRGRMPPSKTSDMALQEQSESDLDVPPLVEDICADETTSSDAPDAQPVKALLPTPIHARVVVNSPSPNKGSVGGLNDTMESVNEEDQAPTTNGVTADPSTGKKTKEPTTNASRGGRKRKASVSVDEQPDQSKDSKPRAKRAATSKTSETIKPPPASPGPVRRSARQRK